MAVCQMLHGDGGIEEVRGQIKLWEMASRAFAAPPNGLLTAPGGMEAPSGCLKKVVVCAGPVQGKKKKKPFSV